MTHTFLLQPGRWSAQGRCFDARYRTQAVRGELQVRHGVLAWDVQGWVGLVDKASRLELDCAVAPSKGGAAARWRWRHPALGEFEGSWELAGRRMFSSFGSRDDRHGGQATFTRKDEKTYLSEGELRCRGAIVCSWELTLRRLVA